MSELVSVTNCVNKLRLEKGITQEELAKEVDVTRQTIITLEKGECTPSIELSLKIAKFFRKPVEEVFRLKH